MGHLVGKDVFRKLGSKIDGLEMRAPWNDKLYAVLKELYTADEADVVVKMPYGLANFKEVQRATGYSEAELHKVLDSLTAKGLVMDIWANNDYQYCISPMIVGIFEFTMMRMGQADSKVWAKVLYDYMEGDGTWLGGNYTKDSLIAPLRTLPHEDAIKPEEYCEVLDYEKASSLIASANKFAIALCSCRHEKQHVGELKCSTPLEKCSQFGYAAEVMIRHKMAREVSRSEMEDNFAESKALGLVLNADNTQRNGKFICHCCKCCCNTMLGVTKHGYPNSVVTSNYLSEINDTACNGCGKCSKACPVNAIELVHDEDPTTKRKQAARVDTALCLGCGVCALQCPTKACKLTHRGQRVIHPETTFERIILQCLDRGTLQNQLFANPQRIDHKFMRAFFGAFLNLPPVKKALLSDTLRSSFLGAMRTGVRKQGKGWVLDL